MKAPSEHPAPREESVPLADAAPEEKPAALEEPVTRELARLDRMAWWLDSAFRIPGTRWRLGLDSLIGFIPGIGDAFGVLLSLFLLARGWRLGARLSIRLQMLFNLVLEMTLGSIPILGDIFDIFFKANERNIGLLRRALEEKARHPGPGDER